MNPWLAFLLGAIATYRLSLMTSLESGPGRIFRKLRNLPEPKSATREGLSCFFCTSIYHAIPITAFLWWRGYVEPWDTGLYWLALSGAAIILHRMFTADFKK